MKLAGWMILASVSSAVVLTAWPGLGSTLEIWLGMIGPLAIAAASWVLVERTYRKSPGDLTRVQVRLFAGRMVIVGGYLAVVLGISPARPIPFVASFVGYFAGLHAAEAIALHRLLEHPHPEDESVDSNDQVDGGNARTEGIRGKR